MAAMRLGLVVNPIAGIGGRVGLKGSDGLEIQQQAWALGAKPLAQARTALALEALQPLKASLELMTAPGQMGETVARECGFNPIVVSLPGESRRKPKTTTAEDTRNAIKAMAAACVDLILFAGGDGTARDIYQAIGSGPPVLGIPAGVKIHSAVFAVSPRIAGELARAFLENRRIRLREAEVIDLDEASYQQGMIATRLFGYLKVPYRREQVQNLKVPTPASEAVQAQAIAGEIVANMAPGRAYLLGPGTTTRAIADRLGLPKTLVGVDILTREEVLALDVGEKQILECLNQRHLSLIVTPIGGQGFLFGRGNQQISPKVLQRVGKENILVASLPGKLAALRGAPLLLDCGDEGVDRILSGYFRVVTGYRQAIIYKATSGNQIH